MEIKKINLNELTIDDAYVSGGSFNINAGTYNGNWYQAHAKDNDDNEYTVIWTDVDWDQEESADACDWDNPDYVLDEYGYECEFVTMYGQEMFWEMIKDWKTDNSPEYDDLEIKEITKENGQWVAYAQDEKTVYSLTDDNTGNIVINYSGIR